jgi:hypothetical protein
MVGTGLHLQIKGKNSTPVVVGLLQTKHRIITKSLDVEFYICAGRI